MRPVEELADRQRYVVISGIMDITHHLLSAKKSREIQVELSITNEFRFFFLLCFLIN